MTSTAVMASSWGRARWRHSATTGLGYAPAPMNPAGNVYSGDANGGQIGLTVEIYLGGMGWVNISTYCYYRDKVHIQSRGRQADTVTTSSISPQTCTLTLNNRDGRFTPLNAGGPYYGLIGRNTPLRVSRYANGIKWERFYGEVTAWPTTWDQSGSDVFQQITVAGQARRLQQGNAPLQSPMRRGVPTDPLVVSYWPCEDSAGSTQIAAAIGTPMAVSGTLNAGQYSAFTASNPLPTLGTDSWFGSVGPGTGTSGRVSFFVTIPTGTTIPTGARIASITMGGALSRIDVSYDTTPGIRFKAYDMTGALIADSGVVNAILELQLPTRITMNWDLNGSGSTINFGYYSVGGPGTIGIYSFNTTTPISGVSTVSIATDGNLTGASVGHIWVQGTSLEFAYTLISQLEGGLFSWTSAFSGENPILRFERLCAEQGVNSEIANGTVAPQSYGAVAMGLQSVATFLDLLQQAADSDLSILYEARDQLGMAIRTRVSMYNQTPKLVLDVAQHQLGAPLIPLDDDQYTVNDIIVQRVSGSSFEAVQTTGALNTSPPPSGVGDYQNGVSLSLQSDSQLQDQAGWRLHMGTVPDPRYPSLEVNLANSRFSGNEALLTQVLSVDVGDYISILNPLSSLPPDPVNVIVQGYSEQLGIWEHTIDFATAPEAPFEVAVLDDLVRGHADTDGSTLAAALSGALNANPSFSMLAGTSAVMTGSLREWTGVASTITSVGGDSGTLLPVGANVPWGVLITPDGSLNNCAVQGGSSSGFYIPALPLQNYSISAIVNSPTGYGNVELGFDWYDVNQNYLSTSSTLNSVGAGVWAPLSTSQQSAASTAFLRPRVGEKSSPASANILYVINAVAWSGTVSVATTNPSSPLWTTSAGDFPFDINVGAERMTVTGVAGASSPQSFTVTRAVNGVFKPQTVGTDVRLWQPMILSL